MISSLSINYEAPVNFKLENITMNNLNLFVGKNGSGKTMVLIHTWFITQVAILAQHNLPEDIIKKQANFMFKYSFNNPENFTGILNAEFSPSGKIQINIIGGRITSLSHNNLEKINGPAVYASSAMRLFSNIEVYLKMRKAILKESSSFTSDAELEMIASTFKIYNVFYIELLIERCPIAIPDTIKEYDFNDDDYPVSLNVDLEKASFYVTTVNGNIVPCIQYSNGHQSIINMIAATCA